ncbi:MAG TPA: protein kinase [Pyrinomonadaceae bacterium]|nr:protein kinase [Pyrinomonadaceae bacterium]
MEFDRSEQVAELVESALDREPEEWPAFLEEACAGDERLRAEVESLLSHQERARGFIESPAFQFAAEMLVGTDGGLKAGQTLDGYEIKAMLGEGGMGEVYLAEDVKLRRKVAVKLVKRGLSTTDVLRRFRHEEQILANLSHPHIARLFGGGTTADGLPYFVMEYVEGQPVDKHCDAQKLSTIERLKLFRKVCAAVQYAHQHLVIHRDIKPGNILVTPEGEPKLLDFGIAKLLDLEHADANAHTVTLLGVMTPEYASPEQVRGANVTTTTDIYSLGVLLYELLTGHRPYRLKSRRPDEVARVICEEEPERPSTAVSRVEEVAESNGAESKPITPESVSSVRDDQPDKLRRRLSGDLDNIVLMAMRKDPQRRYASVEQFSEDIRRHLEGLPVIARKDTLAYRSRKFVKRHKLGVAAAALILLTLVAGIGMTLREKRRAERRFNDVRRLANTFLFKFDDSIKDLPGSTPSRALIVQSALEYLDSLAQEAGDDPSLQRELMTAYLKVGGVQGNPNNANLGDTSGALESYRKALAIAERLADDRDDAQARRMLGVIREKMCDVQAATGDIAKAVESQRASLAIFKSLAEAAPANLEAQQSLAISYIKLGDVSGNPNFPNAGDEAGAMQSYRSASEVLQKLYASDHDPKARRLLGVIYERVGTMAETGGNVAEALDAYRKSLDIRERLAAEQPTNTDAVRDAAIAYEKIGNVMTATGDVAEALENRRKSLEIFKGLVEVDPKNVQAQQSLALSYIHLGDAFGSPDPPNLNRPADALENYRLALEILQTINQSDPNNVETRRELERVRERIADVQARKGVGASAR